MERLVKIGSVDVPMRASAASPVFYRNTFNRDLIRDFADMVNALKDDDAATWHEILERITYQFAKQADKSIGTMEEWLECFDGLADIYRAVSDIIQLWDDNLRTTSTSKN